MDRAQLSGSSTLRGTHWAHTVVLARGGLSLESPQTGSLAGLVPRGGQLPLSAQWVCSLHIVGGLAFIIFPAGSANVLHGSSGLHEPVFQEASG